MYAISAQLCELWCIFEHFAGTDVSGILSDARRTTGFELFQIHFRSNLLRMLISVFELVYVGWFRHIDQQSVAARQQLRAVAPRLSRSLSRRHCHRIVSWGARRTKRHRGNAGAQENNHTKHQTCWAVLKLWAGLHRCSRFHNKERSIFVF